MQMQSIGRNIRPRVAAGAAALALTATTVSATHYYVAPGRTGDYTADNPGGSPVEAAQKATAAGDVIHLATGLYEFENGDIMVADGVTLVGGGATPEETVVSRIVAAPNGSTNARVIHLGRNAVMRNLTSRGGYTAYQAAGVLGYSATAGVHKQFTVSNCVVENASALYKGGGSMGGMWIDCVIRNCEVRNVSGASLYEGSGGYDAVKCIAGADPKFAKDGPTVFDYYTPRVGSPCRDAGVHIGWMDGAKDIAGNRRIKYGTVDIGALEYCGGLAFTVVVK